MERRKEGGKKEVRAYVILQIARRIVCRAWLPRRVGLCTSCEH